MNTSASVHNQTPDLLGDLIEPPKRCWREWLSSRAEARRRQSIRFAGSLRIPLPTSDVSLRFRSIDVEQLIARLKAIGAHQPSVFDVFACREGQSDLFSFCDVSGLPVLPQLWLVYLKRRWWLVGNGAPLDASLGVQQIHRGAKTSWLPEFNADIKQRHVRGQDLFPVPFYSFPTTWFDGRLGDEEVTVNYSAETAHWTIGS